MKKYVIFIVSFSLMYACKSGEVHDYCQYVDPFIGTADNGHTFPGATAPFGFIQASPETGNDAWKYCSGYNYDDNSIIGFAQNHLNGTGCSDLGDILMLPFTEGDLSDGNYRGSFKKSDEKASPGYYSVKLDRTFTVEALNLSKENMYVQSVELNGSLYTGKSISHKDIMKGGRLVFTMTGEPEK